ncbi:exodeoxyribonuclease V subunit beta [Thalassotalea fusca]
MTVTNLVAHDVPLVGKHLIEASAGTGKTFNITRLYLRLLLEQELTVQQILVMTFTKAATEEIKGRIDSFLRESMLHWDEKITDDPFFTALAQRVSKDRAMLLIKQALLFLDEAAIFTIHGFCQRVLSQHAFLTQVPFNAQLESDGREIELSACRDWYRKLAIEHVEDFMNLVTLCATPESFYQQFAKVIHHEDAISVRTEADILAEVRLCVTQAESELVNHDALLTECLVDSKKGAEREKRLSEKHALLNWLRDAKSDDSALYSSLPDSFVDGRRFSRHAKKTEIALAIEPLSNLKKLLKRLQSNVTKAKAMEVIYKGMTKLRVTINNAKQQVNTLTFDDLISTLADRLNNQTLANTLYQQFPAALVDEFQDTDPKQFDILRAIYGQQTSANLFMIGDPKQAIYGFRGGDIFAYLSARNDCDYQWVMDTNWRSTSTMIGGYNRLFYGNELAQESKDVFGFGIPYLPVKVSPAASAPLDTGDDYKALQFIHFSHDENKPVKQGFRATMANWCALEIGRLLTYQSVQAKDIAILVRDGTEGEVIKQSLNEHGLASVYLSNRANLFDSEQARQLVLILNAILHVENDQVFTAALSAELLGYSPIRLLSLKEDDIAWQSLKFEFIALRDIWRNKSFITMALKLMHDHINVERSNSDRSLTNILHLFEVLQSASQRHHQPEELIHWFEQECRQENSETEAELRLESEENLIRIVTQHGSKGLEYPFVFVPFCTRHKDPLKFGNKNVSVIEFHDQNAGRTVSLDASYKQKLRMAEEQYAESVRLLYVAVTRAEQRCYLLTTQFDSYEASPLGSTLKLTKDQPLAVTLQALANEMPKDIGFEEVEASLLKNADTSGKNSSSSLANKPDASPAKFTGRIERDWWLSSFTALSRNLRHVGVSSPDRDQFDNPTDAGLVTKPLIQEAGGIQFSLDRGAQVGNFLHDVMENLDFNSPDWTAALHWPLKKYVNVVNQQDIDAIITWLQNVISSSLSDQLQLSLDKLDSRRVLKEMEFYFPIISAKTNALTTLLTKHRLANRQQDMGRVPHVSLPAMTQLKGMMHGFIDLVFEHDGKFYVCDYKSNYLGDDINQYQPALLRQNIESHNYDLQYLIYSLALHRYLRIMLDDYSVAEHFGGVYYLYLRGMGHRNANGDSGIYYRRIDESTLQALDNIFDGEVNRDSEVK